MEGSKPTHGKGNRVLHPEPLSEKSGVGSRAKPWEGNRVLHTSKEVGLAKLDAGLGLSHSDPHPHHEALSIPQVPFGKLKRPIYLR